MCCAGSHRVLSLSRDDTVRVWDGKQGLKQLQSCDHYNNTGRWISPFRAIWGPNSDCALVGNMRRLVRPCVHLFAGCVCHVYMVAAELCCLLRYSTGLRLIVRVQGKSFDCCLIVGSSHHASGQEQSPCCLSCVPLAASA